MNNCPLVTLSVLVKILSAPWLLSPPYRAVLAYLLSHFLYGDTSISFAIFVTFSFFSALQKLLWDGEAKLHTLLLLWMHYGCVQLHSHAFSFRLSSFANSLEHSISFFLTAGENWAFKETHNIITRHLCWAPVYSWEWGLIESWDFLTVCLNSKFFSSTCSTLHLKALSTTYHFISQSPFMARSFSNFLQLDFPFYFPK